MKKLSVWILIIALSLGLAACGSTKDASREAANEAIAALPFIEDLTVDDEPLVKAAREAVDALAVKDRDAMMDHITVSRYESKIDSMKETAKYEEETATAEAQKNSIAKMHVGSWKNLYHENRYDPDEFTLLDDMTCIIDGETGTWNMWDDGTISAYTDSYSGFSGGKLIEEDGHKRLVCDNTVYVPADEYQELYDRMFVTVNITSQNFFKYFGQFEQIGYQLDEWGKERYTVWFTPSLAINNGLVFWKVSDDFSMKYTVSYTYGSSSWTNTSSPTTKSLPLSEEYDYKDYKITSIDQTKGSVIFIRQEFVRSNTFNENEYNGRQLTLTDGSVHRFSLPWYTSIYKYTFSYKDWLF